MNRDYSILTKELIEKYLKDAEHNSIKDRENYQKDLLYYYNQIDEQAEQHYKRSYRDRD